MGGGNVRGKGEGDSEGKREEQSNPCVECAPARLH